MLSVTVLILVERLRAKRLRTLLGSTKTKNNSTENYRKAKTSQGKQRTATKTTQSKYKHGKVKTRQRKAHKSKEIRRRRPAPIRELPGPKTTFRLQVVAGKFSEKPREWNVIFTPLLHLILVSWRVIFGPKTGPKHGVSKQAFRHSDLGSSFGDPKTPHLGVPGASGTS